MPVDVIVFFGGIAALSALVIWLVFYTPLVRWCFSVGLYGGLAYLAIQIVMLPYKHATFAASGGKDVWVLQEELVAKVDTVFTTEIGPGQGTEQFALSVRGTVTNKSDRVIESVRIWCRVEKLSLGDSEVASNRFDVLVRPGETSAFSGVVSSYLRGIIKIGFRDLQPPERRFCRVDEVREADQ
jgi:hypothetical protein